MEDAKPKKEAVPGTAEQKLGLGARPLNPGELLRFGVKNGLILETVREKSPAEKAGLKVGDVLLVEHNRPLASLQDLRAALTGSKVPVLVLRDDSRAFITLDAKPSAR